MVIAVGKTILLIFMLIVIPAVLGNSILLFNQINSSTKMGYVYGWLVLLALFESIVVFEVFFERSLTELSYIYSGSVLVVTGVFCALCYWRNKGNINKIRLNFSLKQAKWNVYGIMAIFLLFVQLIIAVFCMHLDADDAYYIGTANSSLSTDTLFVVEPDTGFPSSALPLRYAFSALMIFWAYLSKITGIHPLIITHSIIPIIFISVSYILWWEVGKYLFRDHEKRWIFFLFINLLNIFGNTSVYTQASFLLFRIWQGKALLPNVILPALLLTFLGIYNHPTERSRWFLILAAVIAACCCSSMAVPLGAIVTASGSCVLAMKCGDWKMLIRGFVCCLPCILIGVVYLIIQ